MAKVKNKAALEKMSDARTQLVIKFPFFGYLGLNFKFVESQSAGGQGTLAVDAKGNLYYNPDFIENRTLAECMVLFCHELLHVVQACHARFPTGGNNELWNIAADWVVNGMIRDSNLPKDKQNCPILWEAYPDDIYEYYKGGDITTTDGDKTTEEIYLDLLKQVPELPDTSGVKKCGQEQQQGNGGGNDEGPQDGKADDPRNGLGCASGSLLEDMRSGREQQDWQRKIAGAVETAKKRKRGQGSIPGFVEDFLANIVKPSVTWKDHLRRAAQSRFRGRYSWQRPGRRSEAIGMRLQCRKPSPRGATLVIDTSGSIGDEDIHQFMSECVGIMRQCGAPKIHIYFHDVECYWDDEFSINTIKHLKVQRGGTSHIPVLTKVHEDGNDKGLVICFTDLMSSFPDPQMLECPTLWAVTPPYQDAEPPWGKKVVVRGLAGDTSW